MKYKPFDEKLNKELDKKAINNLFRHTKKKYNLTFISPLSLQNKLDIIEEYTHKIPDIPDNKESKPI